MLINKLKAIRIKDLVKINIFFILISFFAYCQKSTEKQLVKSFLYDVYSKEKSLKQISEEYRYPFNDNKDSNEKFINNVKYLQIEKKNLCSKREKIKVETYDESDLEDLWTFERGKNEKIFVVSIDGKVETYVLIKNFKIVSFVYFMKGRDNPAVFIPYWST